MMDEGGMLLNGGKATLFGRIADRRDNAYPDRRQCGYGDEQAEP